jgi:hypothetical protein
VSLADRLSRTADDYEQRAAHHRERSELGDENATSELIVSEVYGGVAIALRELTIALRSEGTGDEELAA